MKFMKKHSFLKTVLMSALVVTTAAAVMTGCSGNSGGESKGLEASFKFAESKVKDYNESQVLLDADFSDAAFSKAGAAAMMVNEKTSQEDFEKLAQYLFADSITVADGTGKIVACYPEDEKGKTLKESKDKKEFSPLAKGMNVKQMSVPEPADDGSYSLFAGINRGEEGGAVIIGFKTTDYATVTGENLADECGVNTIVLKDDVVLSSTLEKVKAGDKAEDLGIKADDVKKGSLDLKADGTEYKCKAEAIDSFTLICAEPK